MKIVQGPSEGKKLLCENRAINFDVPEVFLKRTNEIFGTSLSAYETVQLIVNKVRTHKDAAIKELSSQFGKELFPKVIKYPPIIATIARVIYRFDNFSFKTIAASDIAKTG